jgi:DNA-binding NarL/FixJ family response regulator
LLLGLSKTLPDVLLLDIQMPGQTGTELAPILLKKYAGLRILTLTNLDSVLYTYNMLKAGTMGYLLKTTSQENLIKAIETVYRGTEFLEPQMREKLNKFTAKMRRESSLKASLTTREEEILKLIVNGDTTKEISEKLHLGFRTVESYRFNILLKLDAKNTASLVRKAIETGIVD